MEFSLDMSSFRTKFFQVLDPCCQRSGPAIDTKDKKMLWVMLINATMNTSTWPQLKNCEQVESSGQCPLSLTHWC